MLAAWCPVEEVVEALKTIESCRRQLDRARGDLKKFGFDPAR